MSDVVKMLEGSAEIPKPLNPFQQMIDGTNASNSNSTSSAIVDKSNLYVYLSSLSYHLLYLNSNLSSFLIVYLSSNLVTICYRTNIYFYK